MELWHVILWAIVTIILVISEIGSVQLIAVWFAAGSLAAFIASLFGVDFTAQIIIFIVSSVLLLILTRPFVKKFIKPKLIPTNADSIIGQTGVVTEQINNLNSTGRIFVNNLSWMAQSFDNSILEVDQKCEIVEIQGVKAIVKLIK